MGDRGDTKVTASAALLVGAGPNARFGEKPFGHDRRGRLDLLGLLGFLVAVLLTLGHRFSLRSSAFRGVATQGAPRT